jgi:anaerobic sulfite reductase subunit B
MLFSTEPYKIVGKEQLTNDIYLFRVHKIGKNKKPELLIHQPGQFYQISVAGIGEAPISVCSFSDEFIEFNIRGLGDVTNALIKLKEGDDMWLRGPYGSPYPMKDFIGKSLLIIGGGTGVASLRSVFKYVEKHRADYDRIHLFFGFKTPEEILFKKDLDYCNRIFDLHLCVDKANADYKGKVALVTQSLEESGLDSANKVAIICGPPAMIKFSIQKLEKMGFAHTQIFVSEERRMKCGIGMCGHCMISGIYVCKDGPVFRYDQIKNLHE